MNKFRKRILFCSIIILLICEAPGFYLKDIRAFTIGMIVWGLIEWILLFITFTDRKNKYWVTRFFDPS